MFENDFILWTHHCACQSRSRAKAIDGLIDGIVHICEHYRGDEAKQAIEEFRIASARAGVDSYAWSRVLTAIRSNGKS